MKKTILLLAGVSLLLITSNLMAADFPKCKEACDRFYTCSVQVNPQATEDQKQMLKKGCDFNCNKPKYYNKIAACLAAGDSCKTFSSCIMKELGGK
ncbi:Cys-rich protein [Leptospira ilyithenensis]|uniref:Cys-rich protein n=1 Tax=Leptospira ilyithenensis TaxID=2484901 RepID=A0A4R9LSL6_9LEPT|nr:Cys-rich protein [Leptospira ilyithenensis]TGN11993.1 Cys-rich protein [Leptospira ilyithenensis]